MSHGGGGGGGGGGGDGRRRRHRLKNIKEKTKTHTPFMHTRRRRPALCHNGTARYLPTVQVFVHSSCLSSCVLSNLHNSVIPEKQNIK